MASNELIERLHGIAGDAAELAHDLGALAVDASRQAGGTLATSGGGAEHMSSPLIVGLTVFVLAVFVGYHVVWRVTPALHSPLMGVTNAISSVIIVGALIAAGSGAGFSEVMGFVAVTLASVNIFGGFLVTHRMLSMFKKKDRSAAAGKAK
ncbi:NAD(P) transhydrogenase subunit alpha [Tistlia consotensis]|uniref:proton-translocating NAD(P)(+) transhydrogenase n=1 Tax=Tistlia consotensis USBA 355 TaxID=560819 RepID=A0A1Y6CFC1_9PROT|nr:NAD(P) transhydrogenase subunit alpha [Tistlia consotensis]SMF60552.1 NAD(P) transhydrogenase subunit alpha [Tistlia consotensis USBA 355]SNR93288.1 NAD(P) transhydrogenase subunit alpha [Tistlia consotensis]